MPSQATGALITYQDALRKEDVLDIITDISPDKNPLLTMLGTANAVGTYHEWPEDSISRDTSISKVQESNDPTFTDLTQPSRTGNYLQIIEKPVRVSATERAVGHYAMADPWSYQLQKAMRKWKVSAEYAALRGSGASGSSGVAREMKGFRNFSSILSSAQTSGTSFTETQFNLMEQDSWDATDEYVFDTVLLGGYLKRQLSGFTAGNTRYIDASDKRLVRKVEIYEGDFEIIKVFPHKDMAGGEVLGLREELCKIAYLRKPKVVELAKTGDHSSGIVVGELTTELRAPGSTNLVTGFGHG